MSRAVIANAGTLFCAALLMYFFLRDYIAVERKSGEVQETQVVPHEPEGSAQQSHKENFSTIVKFIQVNQEYTVPRIIEKLNEHWQVVIHGKDKNTFLYSAHLDTRDTIEHWMVRVVAVTEDFKKNFYCILWKENGKYFIVEAKKQTSGAWPGYHDRDLSGILLSCGVKKDADLPTHVSIVNDLQSGPSTYLPILIPRAPMSNGPQFGACVVLERSDIGMYRVVEWMEVFKTFGVKEVTVYDNSVETDMAEETKNAVQFYIDNGFVVIHPAPNITAEMDEDNVLISDPMFTDCLYRNRLRYQYMICLTMEELLLARTTESYEDMLLDIENAPREKNPATEYVIANANFFSTLPSKSDGIIFLTQRYNYRVKEDKHGTYTSRSVLNPSACEAINQRQCIKPVAKYNSPGWKVNVSINVAEIASYKQCYDSIDDTEEDCEQRVTMLLKDDVSEYPFSKNFMEGAMDTLVSMAEDAQRKGGVNDEQIEQEMKKRPEEIFSLDELQKLVDDPWKDERDPSETLPPLNSADWESFKKSFNYLKDAGNADTPKPDSQEKAKTAMKKPPVKPVRNGQLTPGENQKNSNRKVGMVKNKNQILAQGMRAKTVTRRTDGK